MTLSKDHPAARHRLEMDLSRPEWTSGLPMASGAFGLMLWRSEDDLLISLDRTDVWDARDIPEYHAESYSFDRLLELVRSDRMDLVEAEFEAPYKRPAPTKLPVGRLAIPGYSKSVGAAHLDLSTGIATAELDGSRLNCAALAGTNAGAIWASEKSIVDAIELVPPNYGKPAPPPEPGFMAYITPGRPEDLDYSEPNLFEEDDICGYSQEIYGGAFAVGVLRKAEGGQYIAYVHVAQGRNRSEATRSVKEALRIIANQTLDDHLSRHEAWWKEQWEVSWISVPDSPEREKWWAADIYYMIAAAQSGAPPVALQGPWTVDAGYLPPWKGDYHHNLNTQMTYIPLYTAGRFDAARGMIEWLADTAENCRDWTRRFFDKPGICVPMTCDIHNRQLGGWAPYTHSLTSGSWLAHLLWLHWRHSGDKELLAQKIAPWIQEVAEFLEAIMTIDPKTGGRGSPVSTSPEWNDNRREAFFWDWTNYDLGLTRFTFFAAADICQELGDEPGAERWRKALSECPGLLVGDDDSLLIAPGQPWDQPHRHFSNALAIMPLQQLDPLDPEEARVIDATLARIKKAGTAAWMGYTYSWLACMYARTGNAEEAIEALRIFDDGFRYPNGFHTNGDISGKGYMALPFDCFTLEGNSIAAAAVQDMFVQSRPGRIDLLPAWPRRWATGRARRLTADGAITVSELDYRDGKVKAVLVAKDACEVEVTVAGKPLGTFELEGGRAHELEAQLP